MKKARGSGPRSRDGCFTCRRRKKKCDESRYPICNNCSLSTLECTWPDHVSKIQNLTRAATRAEESASSTRETPSEYSKAQNKKINRGSLATIKGVVKPKKMSKNYILQRISMQQECVEDSEEASDSQNNALPKNFTSIAAPVSSIRERIARQLEVPGDVLRVDNWEATTI